MKLALTLTGAILLIQAVRMALPLGAGKQAVTFALGLFFMAAALDGVGALSLRGEDLFVQDSLPAVETEQLDELQRQQIFSEYAKQLSEDIHRTLPQLSAARFHFDFSVNPFGQVQGLKIESPMPPSEELMSRIAELYGISREVIQWESGSKKD